MIRHRLTLTLTLTLLLSACSSMADPGVTVVVPDAATEPLAPPAAEAPIPRAAVASVVILELKQCCACTDGRQRESRAAFDAALARYATQPAVSVVYLDAQAAEAREYQALRRPVATPAYYFLDGDGNLVDYLQGALTEDQVTGVLGAP